MIFRVFLVKVFHAKLNKSGNFLIKIDNCEFLSQDMCNLCLKNKLAKTRWGKALIFHLLTINNIWNVNCENNKVFSFLNVLIK